MSKIRTLQPSQKKPQTTPVDPSALPDGVYPMQVAADFVKQGDEGQIVLRFRFVQPKLQGNELRIGAYKMKLGKIVLPGRSENAEKF